MTISLDTQLTKEGIILSNPETNGIVSKIIYQHNPSPDYGGLWQVVDPTGALLGPAWVKREAAEFYALARFAETK